MNKECRHNLTVCHSRSQNSNWLVTQFINISDSRVEKLSINVTYSTNCPQYCQQSNYSSFSIWIHETDTVDNVGQNDTSLYQYTGLDFPEANMYNNKTVNASFNVSKSGLYLALVDMTNCTTLYRLIVYYDNNLLECKCSTTTTSSKTMIHSSTSKIFTASTQEESQVITFTSVSRINTMALMSTDSTTPSTSSVMNDTTGSDDDDDGSVTTVIAIAAGFVIVTVILIIIVIINVFLSLAVLKRRKMHSQKNIPSKDMCLASYDPYQAQANDSEEEYDYDKKEGVDDVKTFTVQETAIVQPEEDTGEFENQQ